MRNLKLVIAYDGTNYHGWQSQKNDPTIQDTIEAALSRILSQRVRIAGSGRTDAGVHAYGQVANFFTDTTIPVESLMKGLNSLVAPDILITGIEDVDSSFHARFSAKSRLYEYHLWNASLPSLFSRSYTWWIRQDLDLGLMESAARCLIGRHDFSSFQASDDHEVSPEKEVTEARFGRHDGCIVFSVQANAFLRHMVRNIIGTLVEVGKKRLTPDDFVGIVHARNRQEAGMTAPARGLFLVKVYY